MNSHTLYAYVPCFRIHLMKKIMTETSWFFVVVGFELQKVNSVIHREVNVRSTKNKIINSEMSFYNCIFYTLFIIPHCLLINLNQLPSSSNKAVFTVSKLKKLVMEMNDWLEVLLFRILEVDDFNFLKFSVKLFWTRIVVSLWVYLVLVLKEAIKHTCKFNKKTHGIEFEDLRIK